MSHSVGVLCSAHALECIPGVPPYATYLPSTPRVLPCVTVLVSEPLIREISPRVSMSWISNALSEAMLINVFALTGERLPGLLTLSVYGCTPNIPVGVRTSLSPLASSGLSDHPSSKLQSHGYAPVSEAMAPCRVPPVLCYFFISLICNGAVKVSFPSDECLRKTLHHYHHPAWHP